MSKQVRVNVRHTINNASIRRERRDGRDYLIVPSATMPDGIVMNRIRYPAEEIAKAYGSLENTPAPLGHPTIEGAFVSAKDPEGLARGWIGAWNKNVRRENGRVFVDKVIDIATANQLDGGKAVLNAIEKGEPIHSSTGLYAMLTAVTNDDDVDWDASDIVFDHDAILIGEDGAATPAQGVGLMVNAAAGDDGGKIDVINSSFGEHELPNDEIMLRDRFKSFIESIVRGSPDPETIANQEASEVDKEQFEALSAKVDAFKPGLTAEEVGTIVANSLAEALKPVLEAEAARAEAEKAKAEAEHAELVAEVVNAKLLDEETAKASPAATLKALTNSIVAKPAAFRVNSAFKPTSKADRSALVPKGE